MSIDWARLVAAGRAKAHGIPWTEEEAHARYVLGIPASFVRDGILTQKDYDKAISKDKKDGAPTSRLTRKQLEAKAKKLNIDFTPEVDDATLAAEIEKASPTSGSKKDKKPKK